MSFLDGPRLRTAVWLLVLTLSAIMVLHNVVLQSWGIGTFDAIDRRIASLHEQHLFDGSPMVDADGSAKSLRYARSPAGRLLHFLPAGLWSIIAPFQLSPTFRSKYRATHRRFGRLFIGISVSIAVGTVPLIWSGATSLHVGLWNHVLMVTFAAYFLLTGLLAINHARNKRIASHRVWILRHVAMGYSPHLQRLLGIFAYPLVALHLPGFTDYTERGGYLREMTFLSLFWVAIALSVGATEVWLKHTASSRGALQGSKKAA